MSEGTQRGTEPDVGGSEPEVLVETQGRLGLLTLNRPKAINALTLAMVDSMCEALEAWAEDDSVDVVALRGAGARGLCAGGDIRTLYDAARSGDYEQAETFWRREYALDAMIARYPKPYVALMDGLVMGGGVGVSAHASHRVVTERTRVGMPEVTIGYTPDVGSSIILSRAPDELGTYAALTGTPLNAGEAIAVGMADRFVPSDRVDRLLERLVDGSVEAALTEATTDAGEPPASRLEPAHLRAAFGHDDVERIIADLEAAGDRRTLDALGRAAPFSLKVTLRALRTARGFETVEQALDQDLRLSLALVERPDFAEGVRAAVIDKDRDPKWQPANLADVRDEEIDALFGTPAQTAHPASDRRESR